MWGIGRILRDDDDDDDDDDGDDGDDDDDYDDDDADDDDDDDVDVDDDIVDDVVVVDDDPGHVHFVPQNTVFCHVRTRGGRRRGQEEGFACNITLRCYFHSISPCNICLVYA
jgi:hypothetical protein